MDIITILTTSLPFGWSFKTRATEDLRERVRQAWKKSAFHDRFFVSNDDINMLITRDSLTKCFCLSPNIPIEQMTKVICILMLGASVDSDLITGVYKFGLTDDCLPVTTESLRALRIQSTDPQTAAKTFIAFLSSSHHHLANTFGHLQWSVLSPTFGLGEHISLSEHVALPITKCYPEEDNSEGQGSVCKIELHPAHLQHRLPSQLSEGEHPPMALKKLSQNSTQKDFFREHLALHKLQSLRHNNLIELISSFKQDGSYYFLFPWAGGGHLKRFWKGPWDSAQRTQELVTWAFEQMEGISSAVHEIHNPGPSGLSEENGRHGDLKPQNILLFNGNNNLGTLRVADAGLARFHAESTSIRKAGTTTRGATIEYAPPEALDEGEKAKRSRRFDIWSLGCIYLEFITWLIGGSSDVEEFREKRKIPDCKHHQFYKSSTEKHPEVTKHIKRLRKVKGCEEGTSFGDLLDIIEKHLLVLDYRKRWISSELKVNLALILRQAKDQEGYLCDPKGFSPLSVYNSVPHKQNKLNKTLLSCF
ncbi:kinase-like domain-containing protein [Xylaria grammica]|nr:kinase-like domain-containing protein [Xylaria grammica]